MKIQSGLFLFFFCIQISFGQTTVIKGFVINKDTKQRLAKVFIVNEQSKDGIYNNSKGEFSITVKKGELLIANLNDYFPDSVLYNGQSALYFQLKPKAIQLKEVRITSKISPMAKYNQTKKEFDSTLDQAHPGFNPFNPITSIYNLFSREGKNARKLEKIIERDYRESVVDNRFNSGFVNQILKLNAEELTDYMQQYRPTYNLALNADDYEFVQYVKNSYRSYRYNPTAFRLKKLTPSE
ncbi:MAG: hypothetical protein K2Q03_00070 [Sphingobacteriaceae bacterium]|nr:hypothetical protein [Sphingobacteriaceae bacterium]